jgi:two-component system, chemotaxis family, protein-glutamate methylesterase/glutaminase
MTSVQAVEVVAVATSAGGLQALQGFLGGLPAAFPAAILIVQHLDPEHPSMMSQILARKTNLAVKEAQEGDSLEAGHVYVAPPGRHMLVTENKTLTFTDDPQVHFVRPSADLLLESVARVYGSHAIAVVLTGSGMDGAAGALSVKVHGGRVIVQDPQSAAFPAMPLAQFTWSGRLLRVGVAMTPPHHRVLPQYKELVEKLKERYGEPDEEAEIYLHPYSKGDGRELQAIAEGRGGVFTIWTDEHDSTLLIKVTQHKTIFISYECPEWVKEYERRQRKARRLN